MPSDAPVNAVRADSVRPGLLYAATERGVSVSFDDGDAWQPLQANLPATSVRDLVVHGDDLVIATHGRSFWIMDDVALLRELDARWPPGRARLYVPSDAVRVRRDTNTDTPLPPEESAGQNPPDGAIVDYELARSAREVALEITAADGRIVRRYSSSDVPPVDPPLEVPTYWVAPFATLGTTPGVHRFVWDLRAAPPAAERYAYPISATVHATPREPLGPLVPPGTYRATLVVDGRRQSSWFAVEADPRAAATTEDYARQYEVARRITALMNASEDAATHVRVIRAAFAAASPRPGDVAERAVADDLALLAEPATEPAALGERLAALLASIEAADAAPTAAQIAAFTDVARDATNSLAAWRTLRDRDLPAVNEFYRRSGRRDRSGNERASPAAGGGNGD